MDFRVKSWNQTGLFYTAISRVKTGSSLYLRNFDSDYILANEKVEEKMRSMKLFSPYQFKKVNLTEDIFENNDELKVGYVNIRKLMEGKSLEFLNNDQNLLSLDFLCVADTSLDQSTRNEVLTQQLSNWRLLSRSDAEDGQKHMGLLLLQSLSSNSKHSLDILAKKGKDSNSKQIHVQVLLVKFRDFSLDAAFVYYRKTPAKTDVKKLATLVKHCDLVIGDLNLDNNREGDKEKLELLYEEKRCRLLNEITTSNFNQLDHVIVSEELLKTDCFSTSYLNFTSDHKVVVVRVPRKSNCFSQKFKENVNFDQYKETRSGIKRKAATEDNIQTKKIDSNKKIPKKRNSTEPREKEIPEKILRIDTTSRTFKNLDSQTCWLNSCVQLMLSVFDDIEELSAEGSPLWECFLNLQSGGSSQDPRMLKNILLDSEIAEIVSSDIDSRQRLFQFTTTVSRQKSFLENLRDSPAPGQQDSQDFFTCLERYKENWLDVYNLLMFRTIEYSVCQFCKHESRALQPTAQCLLKLGAPVPGKTICQMLEESLKGYEVRSGWRDENGCGLVNEAHHFVKLVDSSDVKFIIVSLQRLQKVNGQVQINRTSVPVGRVAIANIIDQKNKLSMFVPVAIIQHHGIVTRGDTRGHFTADVCKDFKWYRYSDDSQPQAVPKPTDQGYIYLYKKI